MTSAALVANQRSRLTDTIDDALQVRGDALEAVLDADALPVIISNRGDADAIVQVVDVDGTVIMPRPTTSPASLHSPNPRSSAIASSPSQTRR
ncbi:MAG: hypothetical protein WKF58_19065 [Ilumatobacteraceae bacterium]